MSKITNWTKVDDCKWRNDESGVVVEVINLQSYHSGLRGDAYGFGFF